MLSASFGGFALGGYAAEFGETDWVYPRLLAKNIGLIPSQG